MESKYREDYIKTEFNIQKFAKTMKKKQTEQEVKIIQFIESKEKKSPGMKKQALESLMNESEIKKRKYTRKKNLIDPEAQYRRINEQQQL